MYPLLVLIIFSAWWVHAARAVDSTTLEVVRSLVFQLLVLIAAMLLLPKWVWTALLLTYLLRVWWLAWRQALARHRTPGELRLTPLDQAEPAPSSTLIDRLNARAAELQALGFTPAGSWIRHFGLVDSVVVVLENAASAERATVTGIDRPDAAAGVVQLSARLDDGTVLQVSNGESGGGNVPGFVALTFPGLPAEVLLRVFRKWRERRFPGRAVAPLGPLLESWASDYAAWCRACVRIGLLRPADEGGHPYSPRAAAMLTLSVVYPLREVLAWVRSQRAARLLRSLGETPPPPLRIHRSRTDLRGLAAALIVLLALLPLPALPWSWPWASRPERDAVEPLPAGFVVPPDYPGAVRALERLAGGRAAPLEISGDDAPAAAAGLRVYAVTLPGRRSGAFVRGAHAAFQARGFLLFRYEQNFGIGGAPDQVALAPTYDRDALLRAAETNGANYGIDSDSIIHWLHRLERRYPLRVTGFGSDYVEGNFTSTLRRSEAAALAHEFGGFCPDVISQGVGSEAALAREIELNRTLYCWWD